MKIPHPYQLENILGVDSLEELDGTTIDGERVKSLIRILAKSIDFDEKFYNDTYQDIAKAVKAGEIDSAHEHYYNFGVFEGRLPSVGSFDFSSYLKANEDLTLNLGPTPNKESLLEHYIFCGFTEGRNLKPLKG